MRPIRYIGRHRKAGYGYPLHLRLRRELAFLLGLRLGLERLGYLVDFDRNRYLEEYWAGDPPPDVWAQGVEGDESPSR